VILGENGASGDLALFSIAKSSLGGTYMAWTGLSRMPKIKYVIN